jgi:ATP-dependent DNA helicase DinG
VHQPEPTPDDLEALLGTGGSVAAALASGGAPFEERPEQRRMASAVLAALSSRRHLVVEAGTGVGKTFAYLVPALLWAERTGGRVAVATSTIALQEQIVRKDLPLLARALPFPVRVALVKGRGNYVCLRRLLAASAEANASLGAGGARGELEAIRAWAATTTDGTRQDLPFPPSEDVWDRVRAEAGNCLHRACPHYGPCHYQRARREAHGARLLVLNHHVLVADLALRRSGASFLPDVDAIVVDEAHDFEDTAAEHLGLRLSSTGVALLLGRLWSARGTGLLRSVDDVRLRAAVDRARAAMRELFKGVRGWLDRASPGASRTVRLDAGLPAPDALRPILAELAVGLEAAVERAGEQGLALEIRARARAVAAAAAVLEAFGTGLPPGDVGWAEGGPRGGAALCSAPIDVGERLKEVLWDRHTVVLTSATLAAGSPPTFEFLRSRLGVADADELRLGSPFDFPRQARVVVRADLPDPVRAPREFDLALPAAVLDAVRATRGGAFVLFTSVQSMRAVAAAVGPALAAEGIEVLVQGERLERPAMLERFRATQGALFGVASFWQGVDVRGDALRHVVIARLPFEVPTHPLQEARAERLAQRGKDAFRALSLPSAAIRLKQGFGRLIRTATDRGLVTILDPRIATRPYGRFLLESLPACRVEFVSANAS